MSCGSRFHSIALLAAIALVIVGAGPARTVVAADPVADAIQILPASIVLSGTEARHRLVVERMLGGKLRGEAAGAEFRSSNEAVAVVESGIVIPRGNGQATITAAAAGQTASCTVEVRDMERPFHWSFRNHVQAVLTKTGCNMGACHGAQAGKKGFKLSLRGYDERFDYDVLVREARGRRIVPDDPGRSLILTKPTGALAHGGGLRFDTDSLEYRVIAEWIAAGLTPPKASDRRIEHLEVLPRNAVLAPGAQQQLVVRAHFSDGLVEDVTQWVKYDSANAEVAQVGATGQVKIVGFGEGAITAWYLSKVVIATVTVPYNNELSPEVFTQAPRRNFIDDMVLAKLESLALPPSPRSTDAEFIRRAFIDTIGALPSTAETEAFLADSSADKRDRLIESLLARPEFVDFWAYKWSDLLLVNSEKLRPQAMWAYYAWIRNHVAADTPWDEFTRELITASGSTLENGATNYFLLHQDPITLVENTSQAFLGMSINCARCHDHPLEKWSNDQYFAMANLFSRVRAKNAVGDGHMVVYSVGEGELVQPARGIAQPPQPLEGEAITLDDPRDRRSHLAAWLTSPDNPYFARAITNRLWANFYGRGLVESVDDLRLTNPPSNPDLLEAAAKYLVEQQFDLKSLMRTILQSETYQRSSVPLPGNVGDRRFYSRYFPRRLMAEVALDGVAEVTQVPSQFPGFPKGWRATQLPDSNVTSYFLKTFGRPSREFTCECERTSEPSMVQAMHLANGDTLNAKLKAPGNVIDRWLKAKTPDAKIIDSIYLSALSRMPTDGERTELTAVFAATPAGEKRQLIEDLMWSVLASKEFLFNH